MQSERTWRFMPHWGRSPAKKAVACALTTILLLNSMLAGVTPAIAQTDDAAMEVKAVAKMPDEQEIPTMSAEDAPNAASQDTDPDGCEEDQAKPDIPHEEDSPTPVPADEAEPASEDHVSVPVVYLDDGSGEILAIAEGAPIMADGAGRRIELAPPPGNDGKAFVIMHARLLVDGADETGMAEIAPDKSYIDVPSEIDLATATIEVTVAIEMPDLEEPAEEPTEEVSPEEGIPEEEAVSMLGDPSDLARELGGAAPQALTVR